MPSRRRKGADINSDQSINMTIKWQNQEYRDRMSAISKAKWQTPEYRAKQAMAAGRRGIITTSEHKLFEAVELRNRATRLKKEATKMFNQAAALELAAAKIEQVEYEVRGIILDENGQLEIHRTSPLNTPENI